VGVLCFSGVDDFLGIIVKLLESFKDITGIETVLDIDAGDDVWLAAKGKEFVHAYTGYGHELVCCERVTLRVEFLVEQIEGFGCGAFGLRGDARLSLRHLLPFLLGDGIDGVF
jgi:hypothetical protein